MAWRRKDAVTPLEALMFRELDDVEEATFRDYARTHPPEPGKWPMCHPVCRDEWTKRGQAPQRRTDDAEAAEQAGQR